MLRYVLIVDESDDLLHPSEKEYSELARTLLYDTRPQPIAIIEVTATPLRNLYADKADTVLLADNVMVPERGYTYRGLETLVRIEDDMGVISLTDPIRRCDLAEEPNSDEKRFLAAITRASSEPQLLLSFVSSSILGHELGEENIITRAHMR
jgi:hypothetical protein